MPSQFCIRCQIGCLLLALAACKSLAPTKLLQIKIAAELNANQNIATAIDIVFAYDENAVKIMPKSGPEWFSQKTALLNGLANSVDVVALQVPPATIVEVALPARYQQAVGVYSFANYVDPSGQPVGNLTPYKSMTIWLKPNTVTYQGGAQ
ncbi:hypothetical protein V8J88_25245 [Massilia sp. W12]|uniref:hypothetical protein n=1 Tax=Massilia sp. W12 TaxID=3126507 RepID=UPI0030D3579D